MSENKESEESEESEESDETEDEEETVEETKTCNKCGEDRSLDQYSTNKRYNDNLDPTCKICMKKARDAKSKAKGTFGKPYRKQATPLTIIDDEEHKRCYVCKELKPVVNFSKSSKKSDGYAGECRSCASKKHKKYHESHKEERKSRDEKNKPLINARDKAKYQNNEEYRKKKINGSKEYYKTHKEQRNARIRQRKIDDPVYKVFCNLNASFHAFFEGKKIGHIKELIGIPRQELETYLEDQFDDRMNWSNNTTNGWHVDHIVPRAYFKKQIAKDGLKLHHIKRMCYYKNLKPLWGTDNIKKGDVMTQEAIKLLEQLREEIPSDDENYTSDLIVVNSGENEDSEVENDLYGTDKIIDKTDVVIRRGTVKTQIPK